MANCYVVTAHKATAVTFCATGNFTAPDELNLLLAKSNRIEIHLVTPEGLRAVKEITIYGKIGDMKLFRTPGSVKDYLFVITTKYNAMILQCNGDSKNLEIVTRAHGLVSDQIGKAAENGIISRIDPDGRVIGLRLYDGLLKILPLDQDNVELRATSIRMDEMEVQDIAFLYGCAQPTVLVVYQDVNGRHIRAHEISMRDKEFTNIPWKQENIETEASMIIAVPDPIGGAIIIGNESVLYHNGTYYVAVAPPVIKDSALICYARIDAEGRRYLLGSVSGYLFMLLLEMELGSDGILKVKTPTIELLGEISIPESITYLDNGVIFVGSRMGDSQLVKLNAAPDESGYYVTIMENFTNLGPIVDMCVVDLEKQGQGQLVTCSGCYKDGSLRIIRNGIGIQEHASIDIAGVKGIWVLRRNPDKSLDDTLVLSFVGYTRVLAFNGDDVEETDIAGFISDSQTFYCSNVKENVILQVTNTCAVLIHSTEGVVMSEWKPPSSENISVVSCCGTQLVCAIGATVYYIEIEEDKFTVRGSTELEYEVSCLDVSTLFEGKKSAFVAVGLWTEISTRILKLPSLREVSRELLGCDIICRSILMTSFEGMGVLLCALGDGSLFYFTLDKITGALYDKKKVTLGTQPITLRAFRSHSTINVFASSDRPAVIYSSNHKLVFSNVNLKQVNYMCMLNAENFPDSLAMSNDTCITIGTIDEIQKLHIRTIPLGEGPRRIAYQESSQTFGVVTMRIDTHDANGLNPLRPSASTQVQGSISGTVTSVALSRGTTVNSEPGTEVEIHNLLIFDQHTFEVLHAHHLPPNEYIMSLASCKLGDDSNMYYIIGTAVVSPDESEPKVGRIVMFHYDEGRLLQITEKEVKGACYTLQEFNGKLLASVNSTVRLFEWTAERDLRIECSHFNNIAALHLKTKGDFVLVGDLMRSVTLLQYKSVEGCFEEIGRDYHPNWTTAVEIIDDDTFVSGENHDNLFITQRDSDATADEDRQQLQDIGQIYIGDMINVFRKGSLVMQHAGDMPITTYGGLLYGTVLGAIGMITQMPNSLFAFLEVLQSKLTIAIKAVGKIDHGHWRSFYNDIKIEPAEGFVDGDLIETFLDLPPKVMEAIATSMKGTRQLLPQSILTNQGGNSSKDMDAEDISAEDIIKLVEELSRLH